MQSTNQRKKGGYQLIVAGLSSVRFFYAILAFFGLSAGWIALSGRYPMAYDESSHLGLIRLYSHHLLPFWSQTPVGSEAFGAVARDPSYLYHYLLSFPYRLLSQLVHSEMNQVICLRFFSIVCFAFGLGIFRKLLLKMGASRALVHSVLALFVLTPIVPFVAAQVNYDNLFFPLVGLALLLTLKIAEDIKQRRVSVRQLLLLTTLCLLTSLVKYAFLPLFGAIIIWLGWLLIQLGRKLPGGLSTAVSRAWTKLSQASRIGLIGLVVVSGGLFMERYAVNTWRYHTPVPQCDQVLSVPRCFAYGPWRRDYLTHQDKIRGRLERSDLSAGNTNLLIYTFGIWLPEMTHQPFFVLNGETSQFAIGQPLPLPLVASRLLAFIGVMLFAWWYTRLRRTYQLDLLLLASVVYVATLWAINYRSYYHTGLGVAIQARYLVPVLPIAYLGGAVAYRQLLGARHWLKLGLLALATTVLLVQGGGATVFILRSDSSWYWPNATVIRVNRGAQSFLKKFVIGV